MNSRVIAEATSVLQLAAWHNADSVACPPITVGFPLVFLRTRRGQRGYGCRRCGWVAWIVDTWDRFTPPGSPGPTGAAEAAKPEPVEEDET